MKFGNFLFPESADPGGDARVIEETIREARISEALGIDALWLAEHHFDGNCAYVDPVTFAVALARETARISIGFAVLQASLYHPVRLAEQLSLLDHLSKGRLIVGLGRGTLFNIYEYQGYGIDHAEAQGRFEELREVLLKCWTGQSVNHHGQFWDLRIPSLRPRPYTVPHPTLIGAASGEASLAAFARAGVPFLMNAQSAEVTRSRIEIYRREMRANGFDERQIEQNLSNTWIWRSVFVTRDRQEAVDLGTEWFTRMQASRSIMRERIRDEQGLILGPSSLSTAHGLMCGSLADVSAEIAELHDIGVGGVILQFRMGVMPHEIAIRSLELFMQEVAPAFTVPAVQE